MAAEPAPPFDEDVAIMTMFMMMMMLIRIMPRPPTRHAEETKSWSPPLFSKRHGSKDGCVPSKGHACRPAFYVSPMVSMAQMDLKVHDGGVWAGRVQLARAVIAADAWQPLVLDRGRERALHGRAGHGLAGGGVDGGIAHEAFEGVVQVGFLQPGQAGQEPWRWWGLDDAEVDVSQAVIDASPVGQSTYKINRKSWHQRENESILPG